MIVEKDSIKANEIDGINKRFRTLVNEVDDIRKNQD